jgi:hypothetical protein
MRNSFREKLRYSEDLFPLADRVAPSFFQLPAPKYVGMDSEVLEANIILGT